MTEFNIYKYEDEIFFNSNEIIPVLGYKNVSQTLKNVSSEYYMKFRDFKGNKEPKLDPRTILISKYGISELLTNTSTEITEDINNLLVKYDIEFRELLTYSYISNGLCFEYFIGYEIATLLGYKNPARTVINTVSKSNQLVFREYPGVKIPEQDPKTILITREGVCDILIKTRKRLTPDVLHILKKFQIETTNKKCLTKEQQTLSAITNALKTEQYEDQYKIDNYYLDLYFTEYKLIIECDENGHADRKPCNERERMDYVNNYLNIDDTHWIRYNPDEFDFDISKVIGKIYRKIDELKQTSKNSSSVEEIKDIFQSEKPELDYIVGSYVVDLYFPKYKIIVETVKQEEDERLRMDYINVALNINDTHWIRFDTEEDTFDINKIVRQFYLLMKEKGEVLYRICATCKISKPLYEEYHKSVRQKYGREYHCKSCRKLQAANKNKNKRATLEKLEVKICEQCNVEKQIDNFWLHIAYKDGYYKYCKECGIEERKTQQLANKKEANLHKKCSNCNIIKNTTDFGKLASSKDGFSYYCKNCSNSLNKEWKKRRKTQKII